MATVVCSRSSINGDDTTAVPGKMLHVHGADLLPVMTGTKYGATVVGEEVHSLSLGAFFSKQINQFSFSTLFLLLFLTYVCVLISF